MVYMLRVTFDRCIAHWGIPNTQKRTIDWLKVDKYHSSMVSFKKNERENYSH
jgi:hypothetical protein